MENRLGVIDDAEDGSSAERAAGRRGAVQVPLGILNQKALRSGAVGAALVVPIRMLRQMLGERMYPLTLDGLDKAMRELLR